MQSKKIEEQIEVTSLWSPAAQLADACDLSLAEVSDAAAKGAVWQVKAGSRSKPRRIRDIEQAVSLGDVIFINYHQEVLEQKALAPQLVSDQGNYSIWYKPSGMLSQGTRWSDHTTITFTASEISSKKSLLVHRLDRAACGLILLAHTKNAQKALCALFERGGIGKIYRVQVIGKVEQSLPWTIDALVDGKKARTVVQKADRPNEENYTTLTVSIETGRKHQIRSHLAAAGYPVVGDRLFDPQRDHNTDLQLAACELHFTCPFNGKSQHVILDKTLLNF